MLTPTETGIAERVNELYQEAIDWAGHAKTAFKESVMRALECGALLGEQRQRTPHGQWEVWLRSNCPDISPEIARRWIICSKRYNGSELDCPSLRQLYIACGILPEPESAEAGEPQPEKTIFSPFRKFLDFYTPDKLEKLNDVTGPGMLRLIHEAQAKLSKYEKALTAKFGAQKYG